jgi:hypothetical protein
MFANSVARAFIAGSAILAPACAGDPLADFDNRASLASEDKLLALVGEKLDVVEVLPDAGDAGDPDTIVIVLDAAFRARYRVIDVVHGAYSGQTVDFEAYDHYGYPKFAQSKYALLYLVEREGRLYHWKYLFDRVYPTADGRFAGCGDPYPEDAADEIDRRPLAPIEFKPPVVFSLAEERVTRRERPDLSAAERTEINQATEAYFSPPAFEVRGDRATCRMGAYPEELFRIANETTIKPRRRSDTCIERLGLGAGAVDPEGRRRIEACLEGLKANDPF